MAHFFHSVHVQPGLCRTNIDRRTDKFRLAQGFGNTVNQSEIPGAKAFMYQSRIPAHKVHARGPGCSIQSFCVTNRIYLWGSSGDHSNGGDGNAFMNNRNTVFTADIFAGFHQVLGTTADFVINFLASFFCIRVDTVEQRNPHGNRTYVQIFVVDHADCFQNIMRIDNAHFCSSFLPV